MNATTEIPLKEWALDVMEREQISRSAVAMRFKRGRYRDLKTRRQNARRIFVILDHAK